MVSSTKDADLRNFKDFLQIYNLLTEKCFKVCIDNFNTRELENQEIKCAEDCASKFIKLNHRFMALYVVSQQIVVNRRIKEAEQTSHEAQLPELAVENKLNDPTVKTESPVLTQPTDVSVN